MKIHFNPKSENKIIRLKKYILQEWGIRAVDKFDFDLSEKLELLYKYPSSGILEEPEREIRSFIFKKHLRVFYRYTNAKLIVFDIFDERQNPNERPYNI